MSLRRCMRRLRDASEMHSCPLGIFLLQHRFFPIKFANLLRTPFFAEHIRWLLLKIMNSSSHLRVLPICYKIVSPILLKELINDFAVCKYCSEKVLLDENVTNSHDFGNQNYIFQKGVTRFNRSTQNMLHFYVRSHELYIFYLIW